MATYRGAKVDQEVIAEYTDNSYARCRTCLKLADGKFYKASMAMTGRYHVWQIELIPKEEYPMLYTAY